MRLGSLSHPAARRLIEDGAVALLPVGATEAHGPHLPLDTDVRIAEAMCERALPEISAKLGLTGILLPPVAYSVTEYAGPFVGTVGVPAEAARVYLTEVVVSAGQQGFRAVAIVNAHLEPAHRHVLRSAAESARARAPCPVTIADPCDRRWVPTLTEELQSGKCHAGQYETSLVLAAGGPVDLDRAAELPAVDVDLIGGMKAGLQTFLDMGATRAYFGDPRAATVAEGHDTFRQLAHIVTTVLGEALESEQGQGVHHRSSD